MPFAWEGPMSNPDLPDLSRLPDTGAYRLTIRLSSAVRVRVGRLGMVSLPAGTYVYCGSARRGLHARVGRHLRRSKRKRWHIDYLLARREAKVVEVAAWSDRTECELAAEAIHDSGQVLTPGFGSSDCRSGCGAHLARTGEA